MNRVDETQAEKSMFKIVYFDEDSASDHLNMSADGRESMVAENLRFEKESIDV